MDENKVNISDRTHGSIWENLDDDAEISNRDSNGWFL